MTTLVTQQLTTLVSNNDQTLTTLVSSSAESLTTHHWRPLCEQHSRFDDLGVEKRSIIDDLGDKQRSNVDDLGGDQSSSIEDLGVSLTTLVTNNTQTLTTLVPSNAQALTTLVSRNAQSLTTLVSISAQTLTTLVSHWRPFLCVWFIATQKDLLWVNLRDYVISRANMSLDDLGSEQRSSIEHWVLNRDTSFWNIPSVLMDWADVTHLGCITPFGELTSLIRAYGSWILTHELTPLSFSFKWNLNPSFPWELESVCFEPS